MKYILVATNQDVLLFKLLTSWGGATNRDVLLTEACYCSRLYGILIDYRTPLLLRLLLSVLMLSCFQHACFHDLSSYFE